MGVPGYVVSVALAVAVTALPACSGDDGRDEGGRDPSPGPASSTATAAPAPASDFPEPVDVTQAGGVAIPGGDGDWAMAVRDDVWVSGVGPGLVGYDGRTGRRVGAVRAGPIALAMEEADGDLWAATVTGQLLRVDGRSRTVESRTRLGATPLEEASVTVGGGEVFVPTQLPESSIVVADASTGQRLRRIPAPADGSGLRYGFGSLWMAVAPDRLVRMDPRTGDVQQEYTVGILPVFVSVGPTAVWVMNQSDGSVSGVSPRSGEVTTVVVDTGAIQGGDILAAADAVWVRVTDVLVARVDARTGKVTARIGPQSGSGSVALSGRNLWITAHDVHTIWRVPGQD
jgi:hypothetical protein